MATQTNASSLQRVRDLFDAASMLAPAARSAFLEDVCQGDARPGAEVEALLARGPLLSSLATEDHQRISGLFHAAFALSASDRRAFLDRACAGHPADRRYLDSLLSHAEDSSFLETAPVFAQEDAVTRTGPSTSTGAARAAAPPPGGPGDRMIGRRVREYEILAKLGEGGMGVVYLALDTNLQKHVALKAVRPEYANDPEYRRRLVREAQLAAQLSHPNIATVHALFEDGRDIFIVSEFVKGSSLREVVNRGPMSYARLLAVFTGIATGLEAAHARGIIHRDLKPDNILLTEDDVPKIVDFGLAKSRDAILGSTRLQAESRPGEGTPAYMAPEQIEERPERPLDFRCDQFAFGVTLYEAATGINPFEGRSLLTTLENIKYSEPPALSRPGLELDRLDAIVRRCLRKSPGERYASTGQLVHDLEQLSARPTPVPAPDPPSPWPSPRRWWEVHQIVMALVYGGMLTYLWLVHGLAQPLWAARLLMFTALVAGALLVCMRAHFWFASRFRMATLSRSRERYGPGVRGADWIFSATLAALAALMLIVERPGTAAPLAILAVVNVVVFLVIERAAEDDAFPG